MSLTEDKKFKTMKEAKRKVSLLFISRHMKVIQNALRLSVTVKTLSYTIRLSVTIKEYKEVPLSLRGRTHSLKLRIIPSTGYFERRQR